MHVYMIQNLVNGKCYIGQHSGENLAIYWKENVKSALRGSTGKRLLYRAIRKYGPTQFTIHSLVQLKTKEEMDSYEIVYIKLFGTQNKELGYNLTAGGDGCVGLTHSAETREVLRQHAMRLGIPKGFREGQKLYLDNRVFSKDHIRKISESKKNKPLAEAHKAALRKPKVISDDMKLHLRSIRLGRKQSAETIAKRAQSNRHKRGPYKTKVQTVGVLAVI